MWRRGKSYASNQREQNDVEETSDRSSLIDEIRNNLSILTNSTNDSEGDLHMAYRESTSESISTQEPPENVFQASSVSNPNYWPLMAHTSKSDSGPTTSRGRSNSTGKQYSSTRLDILKAIVTAFPINVPLEQLVGFVDADFSADFAQELKEMLAKTTDGDVNVFKLEKPWEPKWFLHFLQNLIATTRDGTTADGFFNTIREERRTNWIRKSWSNLRSFVTWIAVIIFAAAYVNGICWMLEYYDGGTNFFIVPLSVFATIVVNAIILQD